MNSRIFRWSLLPALALAIFAACSEQGAPTELIGPDQISFGKGKETAPGQVRKAGRVKVKGRNGRETTYVLATGQGGLSASRTVFPGRRATDVVDIALPGVGGLRVPVTAISKPTTFTIATEVATAPDGGEYLAIDLNAVTADASHTNVGQGGFNTDVTLYLNKPAQFVATANGTILWVKASSDFHEVQCRSLSGGTSIEGKECVTDTGATLEARLKHFSIYTLGWGVD